VGVGLAFRSHRLLEGENAKAASHGRQPATNVSVARMKPASGFECRAALTVPAARFANRRPDWIIPFFLGRHWGGAELSCARRNWLRSLLFE